MRQMQATTHPALYNKKSWYEDVVVFCCGFLHINRSGLNPYPVIYKVANPVRGLLDRRRSEEHLQTFNERNNKHKQNNITKTTKRKERLQNTYARKIYKKGTR